MHPRRHRGRGRRRPRSRRSRAYGEDIGLAFQIADDVLDATATSEELGKTAGRDAAARQVHLLSLLGVDGARAEAERLGRDARVAHLERGRGSVGAHWGPWPGIL